MAGVFDTVEIVYNGIAPVPLLAVFTRGIFSLEEQSANLVPSHIAE